MGSTGWTQTESDRGARCSFCVGSIARARQKSLWDTKQALRCGSEARLPSNGLSSFRSRDVEHRHYVVCRRVRRFWPLPQDQDRLRNGPGIREGIQPNERIFQCKFYSVSFPAFFSLHSLANHSHSPSSLIRPNSQPFLFADLPAFFQSDFCLTISRDLYASSINQTTVFSRWLPVRQHIVQRTRVSPWREKNTTRGKRVDEFWRVASYRFDLLGRPNLADAFESVGQRRFSNPRGNVEGRNNAVRVMYNRRINEIRSRIVN